MYVSEVGSKGIEGGYVCGLRGCMSMEGNEEDGSEVCRWTNGRYEVVMM